MATFHGDGQARVEYLPWNSTAVVSLRVLIRLPYGGMHDIMHRFALRWSSRDWGPKCRLPASLMTRVISMVWHHESACTAASHFCPSPRACMPLPTCSFLHVGQSAISRTDSSLGRCMMWNACQRCQNPAEAGLTSRREKFSSI